MTAHPLFSQMRNLFIYMGGIVLVRGSHLLFMPLWFALISPAEYGLVALLTSFQLLIRVIISAGQTSVMNISFFQVDTDDERRTVLGGIIATQLIVALPVLGLLGLLHAPINRLVFQSNATSPIVFAVLLSSICNAYSMFGHTWLTLQQRARTATVLHIIGHLTIFFLTYLFIVHFGKGASGIIYAQLCGNALAAGTKAWSICGPYRWPRLPQNLLPVIKHNLSLGIPFSIKGVSKMLTNNIDRWILLLYTSLSVTGWYSLATQVAMLGHECILTPFLQVYTPYLYQQYQQSEQINIVEKQHRRIIWLFSAVCSIGILAGYLVGVPLVRGLLPTRFHNALPLCVPLSLEKVFFTGSILYLLRAHYHKKTVIPAAIITFGNVLNCMVDLVVVHRYGALGCAYASLATTVATFAASAWYAQRLHKKMVMPASVVFPEHNTHTDQPHTPTAPARPALSNHERTNR